MIGFETLLNSPIAGTIAGAALGALGGKDKKQTQTTKVDMPENVRSGFDRLIEMSQPEQTAYQPAPTTRYQGFGTIFDSPEMAELQKQSNAQAFAKLLAEQNAPAETTSAQEMPEARYMPQQMAGQALINQIASTPAKFAMPSALGNPMQSYSTAARLQQSPDTFTNPWLGTDYSKSQAMNDVGRLAMGIKETPEQMLARQENIGSLNYDPTENLVTALGPALAGAILAGPAFAANAFLAGPMQPGALSAIKGAAGTVSSLGKNLAGGTR